MTAAAPPQFAGALRPPSFGLGCAPIGDLDGPVTDEQAVATSQRSLEVGIGVGVIAVGMFNSHLIAAELHDPKAPAP